MNATLNPLPSNNGNRPPAAPGGFPPMQTLDDVRTLGSALGGRLRAAVQGRDDTIRLVLIALFADGHVLLEDHPGSGKTTLANALGSSLVRPAGMTRVAAYRRIQFTPDKLPSDLTGVTMFDTAKNSLAFNPGPLFANIVLADEINRTPPKVQAALLEAMAEKQVTVDNQTHPLEPLFFVIATQNPFDQMGTYPLPRAQLDRFLFKIKMTYLSRDNELDVLHRRHLVKSPLPPLAVAPATIVAARFLIQRAVRVAPAVLECLVDIAQATRQHPRIAQGISTRSLVLAVPALQTRAALHNRDYVSPDDVKALAVPLFAHRLELAAGARDAVPIVMECVMPAVEATNRKTLAA
ncbi:MAG: AAA family ATPase [Planctomycetes bacterium]|nr:AAA family ATPase [Planctomycetota bacterium]